MTWPWYGIENERTAKQIQESEMSHNLAQHKSKFHIACSRVQPKQQLVVEQKPHWLQRSHIKLDTAYNRPLLLDVFSDGSFPVPMLWSLTPNPWSYLQGLDQKRWQCQGEGFLPESVSRNTIWCSVIDDHLWKWFSQWNFLAYAKCPSCICPVHLSPLNRKNAC